MVGLVKEHCLYRLSAQRARAGSNLFVKNASALTANNIIKIIRHVITKGMIDSVND